MKQSILPLSFLLSCLAAESSVVAHWRFEDGAFFNDSSGNSYDLSSGSSADATQVALPATGNGSNFPSAVAGSHASSYNGSQRMTVAYNSAFKSPTFTLEALVNRTSTNANTKSIAGMWSGGGSDRVYLLGIYGTNVLAYYYNGQNVSSGLPALELNTDYYVGVSVDMTDTSSGGVTFYQKNLETGESWTSSVAHTATAFTSGTSAFTIGRTSTPSSPWAGLIDEVRYSNTRLDPSELLIPIPEPVALCFSPPPPSSPACAENANRSERSLTLEEPRCPACVSLQQITYLKPSADVGKVRARPGRRAGTRSVPERDTAPFDSLPESPDLPHSAGC
ncbi:MAG: LamG domain-containing protein [Verrucomicrobiales bacterium]